MLRAYRDKCTVLTALGDAVQSRACMHFSRRFRHETKWAAFFDVDEFVLPRRHATFREFLLDYDHCDGIGINWVMFGDGDHKVPPAGNVIENYLYREAKQSAFIKSVVKGEKLVGFVDNPHFAKLVDGGRYVDAHMNPITSACNDHYTSDIIQLNHYFTKSELEWKRKLERKRADSGRPRVDHVEDHGWVFTANRTLNQVKETTIVDRYGAALAERLASVHPAVVDPR